LQRPLDQKGGKSGEFPSWGEHDPWV
jgi:hypothetical protein